jgi:DNA polymerase I-like protein with 3'-5' exonuclease and polymerase domains
MLELPDLRRVDIVALDIETRDDRLRVNMGSGWPFGTGYICGVSVAYRKAGDISAHYFPIRHPNSANLDPAQVFAWLRDLAASKVRIVTQNGLYDWGWLRTDANIVMPPAERLEEIGALATLVDENRKRYSLDALCTWRGIPSKDDTALKEGAAALGLPKRAKPAAHLWQMPAHYVGPYAEQDAISTLMLFESLDPVLDQEGTRDAYRLEVDLLPMVLEMRRRGIRIDVDAAEQARDHLAQKRDAAFAELSEKLGACVGIDEIGRNKWLAETFDRHNIKYPRTEKGNPSFTAGTSGWMHRHAHWLPQLIVRADKLNNAAVNFLQHYIIDHVVAGRIHAEIHPHRSDEGGTRSLRFSYSKPPLQLMSAHDETISPLIRGVFLPEEGEVWAKPDISQQEFRFICHYAAELKLPRAQEAVDRYRDKPDTDFHALVAEWTGIERQQAKNTNYAKAFNAGPRKFAAMIGKPENEARQIYALYDQELPFVSKLAKHYETQASRFGSIALYDGARRHWTDWVAWVDWKKGAGPCGREEAERRINDPAHPWYRKGPLRRVDTHKALNALIQGSAARHTKLWMRACWRERIVPLLQMHDSLDCSVSTPEQAERVAQLACEAVTLAVPIRVDLAFGRNWADAAHTWEELHQRPRSKRTAATKKTKRDIPPPQPEPIAAVAATAAVAVETPVSKSPPPPWIDDGSPPLSGNGHSGNVPGDDDHAGNGSDDFPESQITGGKILCPFHDDHTPSLQIYPNLDDPHFHCYVCGAHGHLNELEIDWRSALKSPTGQPSSNDDARNLTRAHELWNEAKPIAGTLAERYLAETRGIDVSALPADINNALRFHSHCWRDGKHHPALIALFRDIETNDPAGIHRTWLTPDAQKIERRMFGRWPRPRAIKLWPAGSKLYVGEGIETVLAAATRLRMQPAWAMGPCVNIESLPVIGGVEELVILVDRGEAGEGAAETCCQNWQAAGRRVRRLQTKNASLPDFNDLILKTPHPYWENGFEEIGGSEPETTKTNSVGAAEESKAPKPASVDIEPVDLWGQFDPPALPQGLLPETIERFAVDEAELMGVDASGLAMAALTVCAAVLPDHTQLQVKRHDPNWLEAARLWVGLIGNPSTKKTPIILRTTKPLKRLDAELWRSYVAATECYDQLTKEERKNVERPKQRRLRLEDTTIEAAQEVLKDSPDGVLCIQDELAGWFGAMDKYAGRGATKDRGFWLQSFHGGPYALNRIARGAAMIENLSVSLLGGIQPEPIRKIAADTVDDGLLQRLIPIVLHRGNSGQDVPHVGRDYDALIVQLHERPRPLQPLQFADAALAIRHRLEQRHLDLMACEIVNRKLAAHIGKYDGLFARLCLLWHCIEGVEELTVAEPTARRVADFMHRFLLPHATAFYAGMLELSDDHDRLTKVAGYILAKRLSRVTNRDVQRSSRAMRGLERLEVETIFEQLEALGWLIRAPGHYRSTPPHWQVNPEVHRRFAERAEREIAERAKEHEMLQEMYSGGS